MTYFWTPCLYQSLHFWTEASGVHNQSQHLGLKEKRNQTSHQPPNKSNKNKRPQWAKVIKDLLYRPRIGGESGGGLGKVNLTVYSLGLLRSSVASRLSSSCWVFFPFCCFLVRASFVCFSWKWMMENEWKGLRRLGLCRNREKVKDLQLVWWIFLQPSDLWAFSLVSHTASGVLSVSVHTSS